jgi:two-component system CheB/CheR fusion protein
MLTGVPSTHAQPSLPTQPNPMAGASLMKRPNNPVPHARVEAGLLDPALARRLVPRLAVMEAELAAVRTELQEASGDGGPFPNGPRNEGADQAAALTKRLEAALQEQRTRADDLEKILYSTNVATISLDLDLRIRFFTPATLAVFAITPGDVGRPLAEVRSLTPDSSLVADASAVLESQVAHEREVQAGDGAWFRRQILPYRTHDDQIGGLVITFNNITKRKLAATALEQAKRKADQANIGKSRFLAAASHDLRQPLQTLSLLQGLLAKTVHDPRARGLVTRVDDMLGAMSGMLDRLLDINEIETGAVDATLRHFDLNGLLERMRVEFVGPARAKGLDLRVLPCSLHVVSDPSLLEQIIRNLLSNAVKFTAHGKILLGCRRRAGAVSVEVWDTGMGIPKDELKAVFEEYHQLHNPARERSRGLGLGLAIVNRLATLLDHPVSVRSEPGKGSVFAVEIGQPAGLQAAKPAAPQLESSVAPAPSRSRRILAVEDDPDMRELIGLLLESEGHKVVTAADGPAALALVAQGVIVPDLLLADYNLPHGLSGLQLAGELRARLGREVPVIILTGDVSTDTLHDVALQHCLQLNKPVKHEALTRLIAQLLEAHPTAVTVVPQRIGAPLIPNACTVFVVDDDRAIRDALRSVIEDDGRNAACFETGEAFLAAYRPGGEACLLVDAYLPGMNGVDLLYRLRQAGHNLPAIMITGNSDVPMAVEAMKAGASDFIEKPVGGIELLASINRALDQARDSTKLAAWRAEATAHVAGLTSRQREIMIMVLGGHPNKNIATDLGISRRTVENHRASIMRKTGSASLPALARLALAASWSEADEPGPDRAAPASASALTHSKGSA